MKYDASMTHFHGDIVKAIRSMIYGDVAKVAELAAEGSPTPLREYLKERYGKRYNGKNEYDAAPSGFIVRFEHYIIDNDSKLQLSWSQVATFIRKFPGEILTADLAKKEDKSTDMDKSVELNSLGFSVKTVNALHRENITTVGGYMANRDSFANNYPGAAREIDKKIGADGESLPAEQTDNAPAVFDYTVLSDDDAEFAKSYQERHLHRQQSYYLDEAKDLAEMQSRFANYNGGIFVKWIETETEYSKSAVYQLIDIHNQFSKFGKPEQEKFLALPKTLQIDISAKSAPPQPVEQVMSGDITTHKEYIELKKELEYTKSDLRNVERNFDEREKLRMQLGEENTQLQIKVKQLSEEVENAKDWAEKSEERADYAENKVTELSTQIRELESRPVDVIVQSDTDAERKFNETIRKINLDFENFRDEADRDLADMRNQRNAALDRAEAAEAQLNAPKAESSIKPFLIKMTMDDFTALIKAVENDPYLKNIIQKAQVIRI